MTLSRLILEAANSVRITMLTGGRVCVELEEVDVDAAPSGLIETVLTVSDVSRLLKTSQRHVRNLMHKERNPIPYYRVGSKVRFKEADIQSWIAAGPDKIARKFIKELKAA